MESRRCTSSASRFPKDEAYPFRGIRFVSEGVIAEAEFPRGTAYGIRRTHLHRILVDHAAACGVHMLWQAAVTGLHPEGALVAGELVRARWVVGADGTSSRVRGWANLDRHNGGCTPDKKSALRASAATTALRPGPISWNCTGAVTARFMSRPSAAKKFVWPGLVAARSCGCGLKMRSGNFPNFAARLEDAEHSFQRTGRHHGHAKIAACVSWPNRVGGRRFGWGGRHHGRRSLPCLSASRAARRVPGGVETWLAIKRVIAG